jgi:hypothetical protein
MYDFNFLIHNFEQLVDETLEFTFSYSIILND